VESHSDVGKTIWFEVAMDTKAGKQAQPSGSALDRVGARIDI
jgi:hypothetical protein